MDVKHKVSKWAGGYQMRNEHGMFVSFRLMKPTEKPFPWLRWKADVYRTNGYSAKGSKFSTRYYATKTEAITKIGEMLTANDVWHI